MKCFSLGMAARLLLRTAPVWLALVGLVGCEEGYPKDMVYGVRTDPLVTTEPKTQSPFLDRPGQWPVMLFANVVMPPYPAAVDGKADFAVLNPMQIAGADRARFEEVLTQLFGTPAAPKVATAALGDNADETTKTLVLDDATLAKGSVLYRRHCLHCHGTTGDGRGPTAFWVNPHPRDYRQGAFKFTSSSQSAGKRKPLRTDLARTIRTGIEGTSMPAFNLLADDEVEPLVSYVIHLSLRGQAEYQVMQDKLLNQLEESIDADLKSGSARFASWWVEAQSSQIKPGPAPAADGDADQMKESVQRGWRAFLTPGAESCIGCHQDYGRQGSYRFDVWGTLVHPADLTRPIYRGGRRPIDMYWRLAAGVGPAAMPAFAKGEGATPANDQVIWDLVNLIQILPYPDLREKYGIKIND